MGNHHQHHHAAGTDSAAETDWAAMAELLDLDGEVLHSFLSEITGWVRDLAADLPGRRILDLGAGTGTGALALLQRFEEADVIALDKSGPLLDRLRDKARDLGLADRVRTEQADLDAAWPAIGTVDLAWASMSLHHMADPDRVLAEVFAAIRPGGLLAVAETGAFPRFLPDDLGFGRPGLEARCHATLAEGLAGELPHLGSDWGPPLRQAGFTIEAERPFAIELRPPLPASAGRYAQLSLRRIRSGLDGRISAGDLAALDTLIDSDGPDSVLRRGDLSVRASKVVWVARRRRLAAGSSGQEGQRPGDVVLHDLHHRLAVRVVTIQQPQRPGDERQMQREAVEPQAPVIEIARAQPPVMLAEAQPQESVLPFDVEEHDALDIDDDRMPSLVDEHVVGPELAVDESVPRAGRHGGGEFPGDRLEPPAGRRHALDPGGGLAQVGQGTIEHDLLT